ncbi:hypothetical protein GQX74_013315 [Glossina fuscipes]|nr:hypothetical protein GQX74_013315 [Glossina fuscipes]
MAFKALLLISEGALAALFVVINSLLLLSCAGGSNSSLLERCNLRSCMDEDVLSRRSLRFRDFCHSNGLMISGRYVELKRICCSCWFWVLVVIFESSVCCCCDSLHSGVLAPDVAGDDDEEDVGDDDGDDDAEFLLQQDADDDDDEPYEKNRPHLRASDLKNTTKTIAFSVLFKFLVTLYNKSNKHD